jgi:hypothetical protein
VSVREIAVSPAVREVARLYGRTGYTFSSARSSNNVRIVDLNEHQAADIKTIFGGWVSYSDLLGWTWTASHRKAQRFLKAMQACQGGVR